MKVVVAGRVSSDVVVDAGAGWVPVVVPVCALVLLWVLGVLWPAALDATATLNAAAITTRFNMRTSASKTHTGRT
jgi:hypothetical protein